MRSDFSLSKSAIDLSNTNPACGHKEVPRLAGHIMVTTRYSDQQGSNSDKTLCNSTSNGTNQCQNGSSNLLTSVPYPTSLTTSVLTNKADAPFSFDQQVQVSQGHTSYRKKQIRKIEIPKSIQTGRPGSSEATMKTSDTLGREFDPGKRDFSHKKN